MGRGGATLYTLYTPYTLYTLHTLYTSLIEWQRKSFPVQKGRGKKVGKHFWDRIPLDHKTAHTHARTNETKQNDFSVGLTPKLRFHFKLINYELCVPFIVRPHMWTRLWTYTRSVWM